MDPGEQTTGTRDEHYNLISVLHHALHGADNCDTYALDAEAAGKDELATFFRGAQVVQAGLAEEAKVLLGILEVPPEPEIAPDALPEGGVEPGTISGGMPPGPDVRSEDTGPVDVRGRSAPEVGLPPEGAAVPGDVSPPSAGVQREPDVRADEADAPVEEAPPSAATTTPSGTAPRPNEDLVPMTGEAAPQDVQRETSPGRPTYDSPRETPPARLEEDAEIGGTPRGSAAEAPPTRETPGEPGRAAQEQRAAEQMDEEQEEEKGLVDKVKDALTGRDESDRQRGQ